MIRSGKLNREKEREALRNRSRTTKREKDRKKESFGKSEREKPL